MHPDVKVVLLAVARNKGVDLLCDAAEAGAGEVQKAVNAIAHGKALLCLPHEGGALRLHLFVQHLPWQAYSLGHCCVCCAHERCMPAITLLTLFSSAPAVGWAKFECMVCSNGLPASCAENNLDAQNLQREVGAYQTS